MIVGLKTYLKDIIAESKDNRLLQTVVSHQILHASRALLIHPRPVDIALKGFGHIVPEVIEQIDLAISLGLETFIHGEVAALLVAMLGRRQVVQSSATQSREKLARETNAENKTYDWLGARTIVVESLKKTPAVPSVNWYAVPYL